PQGANFKKEDIKSMNQDFLSEGMRGELGEAVDHRADLRADQGGIFVFDLPDAVIFGGKIIKEFGTAFGHTDFGQKIARKADTRDGDRPGGFADDGVRGDMKKAVPTDGQRLHIEVEHGLPFFYQKDG